MPNINILSNEVRNLIAAGEVVERPASVVKELVENSIDAGAGDIRVEVEDGGLKTITVTDDGCGMDADDLKLCVERHATSKLKNSDDLLDIRTMGFRGEALPSIAAVSRMSIESRPAGDGSLSGSFIEIDAGEVKRFGEKGSAVGTKATVCDLFYNVPARKKFARTARTELGHIKDMMERLALANPEVRFQLVSDGKEIVNAFSMGDGRQRASEIFGPDVVKQSFLCEGDAGEIRVHGLVGDPSIAKAGARGFYWFVNRRPVRDRTLNHAAQEAFRALLPKGMSPFSVLFVTIPSEFVDVNVHPTKSEVRFLKGNTVHDFVVSAVRKTLGTRGKAGGVRGGGEHFVPASLRGGQRPPWQSSAVSQSLRAQAKQASKNIGSFLFTRDDDEHRASSNEHPATSGTFTTLRPIGQLHNSYILCEKGDGSLVVIDQHAAHERIGFERLKGGYKNSNIESQRLLLPDVVAVPSKTVGYLEDALDGLNKIGWEIEHFGGDNFCVKAVPAILGNINLKLVIAAIAEDVAETGKLDSIDDRLEYLMKVSACHAQVRAGDRLGEREIRHLLREMDEFDWSGRCPHGRPAVFELNLTEIEKKFDR